ncbi:hypothetical protein [Methylobacterium sp. E-046]|uniref:hypothetical protein n=1 Tax=Methylobacterium sp. E-046 TaxID=2836576 RepID=UPI001FBB3545|nr:hypothetical protein [Methylobacterium sp. E-046]MCJ2097489.1 hypothetical protein [Methylobacterium sp. E-046]
MKLMVLSSIAAIMLLIGGAHSETRIEKKLMQFGGPETRTRCIGNLKTKGVPACTVKGWEIRCEDTWIETCTQWATDFQQHEIFLIASGPDAPAALENMLHNAVDRALLAGVSAAIATPGEVAVKTASAIAAFKITLYAELAIEPVLAAMKDQFQLSLDNRSHW